MSERSRVSQCSICGAGITLDAALGVWTDGLGRPFRGRPSTGPQAAIPRPRADAARFRPAGAVTSDAPSADAAGSVRRLRALIAIGHCEAAGPRCSGLTIFGIKRRRKTARRSVPRPRTPASWPASMTGQRPPPSMTTSSRIPHTSPRADGSRPPWATCRSVRYPPPAAPPALIIRAAPRPPAGLARPGSPHRNDNARHRQNPARQTRSAHGIATA